MTIHNRRAGFIPKRMSDLNKLSIHFNKNVNSVRISSPKKPEVHWFMLLVWCVYRSCTVCWTALADNYSKPGEQMIQMWIYKTKNYFYWNKLLLFFVAVNKMSLNLWMWVLSLVALQLCYQSKTCYKVNSCCLQWRWTAGSGDLISHLRT